MSERRQTQKDIPCDSVSMTFKDREKHSGYLRKWSLGTDYKEHEEGAPG